jgi:hypothetical protein
MWKKQATKVFLLAAVFEVSLLGTVNLNCAESGADDANVVLTDSSSSQKPSGPMIIWWASLYHDPEILRLALSSGVFSHAVLAERSDFQRPDYLSQPNFRKALSACRENNVKVIWTRWLYPSQPVRGLEPEDIFTASYYVERILKIKQEAKEIGADLVCFDAEPYSDSPAMPFRSRNLTEAEFKKLSSAIETAVKIAGQVDLIVPEGAPHYDCHLYDATRFLGKLVMGTQTYYDIPPDHPKKAGRTRPYDVFGAWVNVTKQDKSSSRYPLFTPREILERQDLWAHKKGLFIYPGGNDESITAVAREFSKIKTIHPVQDSNDVR